jgi:hypothetical protein
MPMFPMMPMVHAPPADMTPEQQNLYNQQIIIMQQ